MKKTFKILLLILLFISITIVTIRITDPFNIKKYIYPGSNTRSIPNIGTGDIVKVKTKNYNAICYFSKNTRTKKMIVLFHGNADSIYSFNEIGNVFFNMGYSILIPEYSGYGILSKYKKSEKQIYKDCSSIISYIQKKYNIQTKETSFIGYSLGTGIAAEMMKRKLGENMILISPYTSISDVGAHNTIPVLPNLLISDNYDTKNKARYIKNKVLLIHGKKDKMIPYKMSLELSKCFSNSEVYLIDEAGHNAIIYIFRKEIFKKIMEYL